MATNNDTDPTKQPVEHTDLIAFFYDVFKEYFITHAGEARQTLEKEYPGMLSDIISNIHNLSVYAANTACADGIDFHKLSEMEQTMFLKQFLEKIEVFAGSVRDAFENITPEQEEKLRQAYSRKRKSDN